MTPEGKIETRIFYLKNMNSTCCIRLIRKVIQQLGAEDGYIKLGEVSLSWDSGKLSEKEIISALEENGFPVLKDKEQQLIEKIKTSVIELIHLSDNKSSIIRNSDYLVDKTGYSYQHLSSIFSQHENMTLERFIILHKIEKVKELLDYDELTLSEIAWQMGYSSVQYLSSQFKKVTGLTVSEYKNGSQSHRRPLDTIG